MEDLKDNNKFKQELALPAAKSLFLQFFKGKQLKGFDVMTEENCFFLMEKGENKEFFKNPTISEQNLMEVIFL